MELPGANTMILAVLVASTGAATVVDFAHRRIPNALSLATAVTGIALAAAGATGITLWSAIGGLALGLVLMLPGHVLGGTGAGDVKLFAATGTVLGAGRMLEAFIFVAIAGGLLALAVAFARGRLGHTIMQTTLLCAHPTMARAAVESPAANNRFPYAPAIAAGCVLAALR